MNAIRGDLSLNIYKQLRIEIKSETITILTGLIT
jgi:hypothetical protein